MTNETRRKIEIAIERIALVMVIGALIIGAGFIIRLIVRFLLA